MTSGSPYRLILSFTMPLLLGNIFQQLYNMVDSVVVGNVIGDKALAAVGTGFPIIFMLSSLFMGIGTGATIMISQFYGARDLERVNQTVNTIYTALIIGIIPLSLIGIFLSEPLLHMMKVPDDGTLEMAKTYMVIIFIGVIGNLGFNINAGILQGFGDSRTSLLFLMIATVINIVLDLVLTITVPMGVAGVALATIIAQIVSYLLRILLLFFFHLVYFFSAILNLALRERGFCFTSSLSATITLLFISLNGVCTFPKKSCSIFPSTLPVFMIFFTIRSSRE